LIRDHRRSSLGFSTQIMLLTAVAIALAVIGFAVATAILD
jgi:hypothetical protein